MAKKVVNQEDSLFDPPDESRQTPARPNEPTETPRDDAPQQEQGE